MLRCGCLQEARELAQRAKELEGFTDSDGIPVFLLFVEKTLLQNGFWHYWRFHMAMTGYQQKSRS